MDLSCSSFPDCASRCRTFHDVRRKCSPSRSLHVALDCFCADLRLAPLGLNVTTNRTLTCEKSCRAIADQEALRDWYIRLCHHSILEGISTEPEQSGSQHLTYGTGCGSVEGISTSVASLLTSGQRVAMMAMKGIFLSVKRKSAYQSQLQRLAKDRVVQETLNVLLFQPAITQVLERLAARTEVRHWHSCKRSQANFHRVLPCQLLLYRCWLLSQWPISCRLRC